MAESKPFRSPRTPRVKLVVTQDIINTAIQNHSGHCVNADALLAAVPGARWVAVDLQTIRFTDPVRRLRYIYLTPRVAQEAIIAFDQGRKDILKPYECTLHGGQVVPCKSDKGILTAEQRLQRAKAGAASIRKQRAQHRFLKDTKHGGSIPLTVGGKPPPIAIPFGQRREYGLRLFSR